MNATLPVAYSDTLEFIIVMAKRLEKCLKRSNFSLSGVIKFGTYLLVLDGISRAPCTSTLAQALKDD
jgi:hypothetical protein